MKKTNGRLNFYASDLMRFQGCLHATALDIRYLEHRDITPAEDDDEMKLVQDQGHAHEAAFTERLRAEGLDVVELERKFASPEQEYEATLEAMRSGREVIAQAALGAGDRWGGYADFLFKVDRPSDLGGYSYEVADTKLSRSPKPGQILQLCLYSDLLTRMQGAEPERAHLELGSNERYTVRLDDVSAYARLARERFEIFVETRPDTRAEPVPACSLCRWRKHCQAEWEAADSLVLLPGILTSQRRKLEAIGVTTVSGLAELDQLVPKLAPRTLERLVSHARLQRARRSGGPPSFERLPLEPGRGLNRLPRPDDGDIFYDIEGDPYYEGGLEYLHGVWFHEDGKWHFKDFWAHDREAEGKALDDLMTFFRERLTAHPCAHIYHYAPYEITALRRLTKQHRRHESFLDQLQRDRVFVDLYSVVTGAVRVSEGGYSIKDLEAFYMGKREGEVATAGASVVAYEKWRETGEDAILQDIRAYNEVDCISTQKLRDWLIDVVRPAEMLWPSLAEAAEPAGPDLERVAEEEAEDARTAARLAPLVENLGEEAGQLVIDLNAFHRREKKPAYWAIFDRMGKDSDELMDDLECLAGLVAIGPAEAGSRGVHRRRYRFPAQDTKIATGKAASLKPAELPVSLKVIQLDHASGEVCVQFPGKAGMPPETIDLLPPGPVGDKALVEGVRATSDLLLGGDKTVEAFRRFVTREAPAFADGRSTILSSEAELPEQVVEAISALDHATLAIQGPPGTGKTYVSALAISRLVSSGRRVAVSSNSHKAIENLLLATAKRMDEDEVSGLLVQKVSDREYEPPHARIQMVMSNDDGEIATASVVGGTAWHHALYADNAFDYLFIDEAGQVSIANLMAMARCARNIVLVGDPMQLPQPVQGSHPGQSGMSCLEYLLVDHRTVPEDRGIFLPTSRRMQDGVCNFISKAAYESRLGNDPGASRQRLHDANGASRLGAHFVPVCHSGNAQVANEEVEAIQVEIERLVGGRFIDRDGNERALTREDILVVAPYNAQVNALRSALPDAVRVGTVDKFQGQEAPVCLVSMATSSAAELPRNLEFLFSLNRINVAVSRAMALALVFASPRLLEVPCTSVEQMKLVNTLCELKLSNDREELVG
ncbi:TM0106 family RecB-like putative nuclease [Maricaulis salignorans]|uniref:TM0106 family RecB-like putative nuclease n=1 Tax=Maricaulis salignorans TaxID=144026 RepID=UPI003A92E3A4